MLSKIKNILVYYDSEPTEITQGIIWLILFPIIYSIEHGLNVTLLIISLIVGFASICSACNHTLKVRKTVALATFLFSVVVCVMYLIVNKDYICPTHWGWALVSLSALFNLKRICNHYYKALQDG